MVVSLSEKYCLRSSVTQWISARLAQGTHEDKCAVNDFVWVFMLANNKVYMKEPKKNHLVGKKEMK